MDEGEEGGPSKVLKMIFSLLLNLVGIMLLFLFEMPFRVATSSSIEV